MNGTDENSRAREFEQMMAAAIWDVLQGRMSIDLLTRLARPQEEETVRYCLKRMSDPHLSSEQEQVLAGLLRQASIVRQVTAGPHAPANRLDQILARSSEKAEPFWKGTAPLEPEDQAEIMRYLEQLDVSDGKKGLLPFLFALFTLNDPCIQSKAAMLIEKVDTDFIYTRRLLQHPNARVRANAIEAIVNRGDGRGLEFLRLCTSDPNNRVRANAGMGLYRWGDVLGLEVLMAMINHPNPLERSSGTWGLGMSGKPHHLPLVVAVELSDPDERVRHHARIAQERIRQRDALQA